EARTPLIISGPSEEATDKYYIIDRAIPRLVKGEEIDEGDGKKSTTGDFLVDEKGHSVSLTDEGVEKVEQMLGIRNLYDPENMEILHGVNQGLRAHALYQRDVDYLIKDGKVVIVDEFTGRMMPGRRWSDGLHQAVEAKEGVRIERENQTLATITFQNYFRMYKKLAGMTGTADTEAGEFAQIYNLDVTVIPTNRDMVRDDRADLVYRTAQEKWNAVVEEIREAQQRGQPVLVGTVSIEKSEMLSKLLNRPPKVPHVVLNAKYHEREASIVAQAGRKGAITIATNMAGRGTDIVLGGNPEGLAKAEADPETEPESYQAALQRYHEMWAREREEVLVAGGLHILGTERHESRRIDNQLRGRSGRQGDPGSSRFYLSLEDDLMRIFGSDRMDGMLQKLGLQEGEAIIHPWINKAIEKAQQKVEARNFDIRKNILKYDNVMNDQRKVVFEQRKDFMAQDSVRETIDEMRHGVIDDIVTRHIPPDAYPEQWDIAGLKDAVANFLNLELAVAEWAKEEGIADEEMRERLRKAADESYAERVEKNSAEVMSYVEKQVLLQSLDHLWREHLVTLDHLRQVIGWRGYAQRDPLNEYKSEAFDLFNELVGHLRQNVTGQLMRIEVVFQPPEPEGLPPMFAQHLDPATGENELGYGQGSGSFGGAGPALGFAAAEMSGDTAVLERDPNDPASWGKVGRNEACPCQSGKKYKHCHGRFG
ncbi:MAG: preprotein translocase subunit SecA, partial [Microvirga sp.]